MTHVPDLAALFADGHHGPVAAQLANLAISLVGDGKPQRAKELLMTAKGLFNTAEDPYQSARCDADIGLIQQQLGHLRQARTSLERARRRFEAMDADVPVAICNERLGSLAMSEGRPDAALQAFEAANAVFSQYDDEERDWSSSSRMNAAKALLALGRFEEALAYLDVVRDALRSRGDSEAVAECDEHRAEALIGLGRKEAAAVAATAAAAVFDACGDEESVERVVALVDEMGKHDDPPRPQRKDDASYPEELVEPYRMSA